MSQKSTRRTRRQASEDEEGVVKASTPKLIEETPVPPSLEAEPQEESPPDSVTPVAEELPVITNGDDKETETEQNETNKTSRPATPENKVNGHEDQVEEQEEVKESPEEMEPLVVSDEPDPELVFEENSDLESGQSSPILNRCKTRRSLSRNVPTPKTPKSITEEEELPPIEEPEQDQEEDTEDLNNTFESCSDNTSTKAQVGGDSTRMELSNLDSNSFLQTAKNKSFGDTLRHLSTRRTIRPISDDYRRRLLQTNLKNNAQSNNYPARYSVERVSSVGLKRKNDADEEDGTKRFKAESPGFFSRFTSPLSNIRNTLKGDNMASSTPKLTGYKDDKCMLEENELNLQMCAVNDGQKRWCLIM